MKTKIKINKKDLAIIAFALVSGLFFGWLFFHSHSRDVNTDQSSIQVTEKAPTTWTCSMHPQIRMDHPGKCPICGMDLIPLEDLSSADTTVSPDEIQMSESAIKIADIQTMTVKKSYPDKEVYLLGKVKPDERNIAELTARFGGRIEKLFVNFTGQEVAKGEKLATIYSPALVTAQKELLEAESYRGTSQELYMAARNKLKLWDLTDEQINDIEKEGKTRSFFDVLSPITGTVTRRDVAVGDYIREGSPLFQVIDLTNVWVMFEAYESDLPWISLGDKVSFKVESLPGKNFTGRVSFIDPLMDPKTRIANVRIQVPNKDEQLKPEMFASGYVTSSVAGNRKDLIIPKTAVLWTGKRSVVYVKVPERVQPTFMYREITLGPEAGEFYVVADGLKEGEEIAVNGVFKIDAAAQLAGKPSMMNPEGGQAPAGHNHGGMNMGGGSMNDNKAKPQKAIYIKQKAPSESSPPQGAGEIKGMGIDPRFAEQLTGVYDAYIPMKNAFVKSDPAAVADQAKKVLEALGNVDMELLSGESHMQWMAQLKVLKENLSRITGSDDIDIQRKAFAGFNEAFYQVIKDFGLESVTSYYQFCPMAMEGNGAYWFSESKEIRNPYYGDAMMKCGSTKETFKY